MEQNEQKRMINRTFRLKTAQAALWLETAQNIEDIAVRELDLTQDDQRRTAISGFDALGHINTMGGEQIVRMAIDNNDSVIALRGTQSALRACREQVAEALAADQTGK